MRSSLRPFSLCLSYSKTSSHPWLGLTALLFELLQRPLYRLSLDIASTSSRPLQQFEEQGQFVFARPSQRTVPGASPIRAGLRATQRENVDCTCSQRVVSRALCPLPLYIGTRVHPTPYKVQGLQNWKWTYWSLLPLHRIWWHEIMICFSHWSNFSSDFVAQ